VMVPRVRSSRVPEEVPIGDLRRILGGGSTRLPVYRATRSTRSSASSAKGPAQGDR
jgi:hypothetical protein